MYCEQFYFLMKTFFFLWLSIFYTNTAFSDVYKCINNGLITYTKNENHQRNCMLLFQSPPHINQIDSIKELQPKSQNTFIKILSKHSDKYLLETNELQKNILRDDRKNSVYNLLEKFEVESWVGLISQLNVNSDGDAILAVAIATNVILKTSPNTNHQSIIKKGSKLYKALLHAEVHQKIKFSGEFYPSDKDYIEELSPEENIAMTKPHFIFRFTELSVLDQN